MASTIQTGYNVQQVVSDLEGNIVSGVSEEEVTEYSGYLFLTRLSVYINNLTEDVYVRVSSDNGFNETYHYGDTVNGNISFDGGDLSSIINYKVEVLSDKANCSGEVVRTIDFVTPMENDYSHYGDCQAIPDFEYCKQYITVPFLASDNEISQSIDNAYHKYLNSQQEEEEEKNKGFFEKVGDFIEKNKTIIFSIVGVIIVSGVLATIVIVKKRRSRLL